MADLGANGASSEDNQQLFLQGVVSIQWASPNPATVLFGSSVLDFFVNAKSYSWESISLFHRNCLFFLNVQRLNQTKNFQSIVQVSRNSNDRHQEQ